MWVVDFGTPVGREQGFQRPGIVVSSDEWNRHAATRTEIEPTETNGLSQTSYARAEDVRSVSADRLVRRSGAVDLVALHAIETTLRRMLEL